MTADDYIEQLMDYFKVYTISELADYLKIGQPSISKWKANNMVNAIKKKCKELGIYNDIFELGDSSVGKVTGQNNIGIQNKPKQINKFLFEKEYEKIEALAEFGGENGIKDLQKKLSELKGYLTKYV